MYAHLILFDQALSSSVYIESLANRLAPLIKEQRGCRDVMFLLEDPRNDYGILTLWESKEDAACAYAVIAPAMEHFKGVEPGNGNGWCAVPSMYQLFKVV